MTETENAVIVLCKCRKKHLTFGIRTEKTVNNYWAFTWAFPIKESSARREGYDKSSVRGKIVQAEEYPGCPYCNGKHYTVCSCGHLNCTILENGVFTCEWCGTQGSIGDYTGEAITAGIDL